MNTTFSHPAFAQLPLREPRREGHSADGFTLVELMMVLAVVAILLTVAVPSFGAIMHSSKLTSASNSLLSSMLLARSEAIKRRSRVTLCKTADGISCAAAGGWEQGWIVFHDANDSGARESGEMVIEWMQHLPDSLRLTGNTTVAKYVSFVPTGVTRLVGGGFQAGTVTVCNASGASTEARQIIISSAGRARVQKVSATSCA